MIFNKLTLKNFKSHKNTTIDFREGISIIVGENGAGKTSILEAISFALFKQFTGKKMDDLVTKNRNSRETMSVTLEFKSNGKEYKVLRSRNGNSKSELSSKKGDNFIKISSGDKAVNEEIQTILNMDSELFLNAIYIRQGEIADLVGKTPAEKKQLIGKLLGIEGLQKAWNNILPLITHYDKESERLKGRTESDAELNEDLKTKQLQRDHLKQKAVKTSRESEDLKLAKKEYGEEKNKMEEAKSVFDKWQTQLDSEINNYKKVEEDVKDLQRQLDDYKKMGESALKLEKYVKKLPRYQKFLKSVQTIKTLKDNQNVVKEELKSIHEQKVILKNEEPLHNQYLDLKKKYDKLNERKINYENDLSRYKQLEKEKDDLNKEIKKNNAYIDEFFKKTSEIFNLDPLNFNDLKSKVNHLKIKTEESLKNIGNEISSNSKEISRLGEGIRSVEKPLKEIKEVDNQCPVCKSDITEEQKNDLITSYENTIKSNNSNIEKLNEEINTFKVEKSNFESILKEINSTEKEFSAIIPIKKQINKDSDKLRNKENELKYKDETEDKFTKLLVKINDHEKELEIAEKGYENYNQARGALNALKNEHDMKNQLRDIENNIDNEVEKIKAAESSDSYLSPNIIEDELEEIIDEFREKETEYNQLKGSLKEENRAKSKFRSKIDDLDSIQSKIDNLKNNINSSSYDKKEYDKLLFNYQHTERRLAELTKELGVIDGKGTSLEKNINELNEHIEENKLLKLRLKNVEDYLDLLKHIREFYGKDGIQKQLRNRSRPIIEKHTKNFFEQFNFDYSDLNIDENYDISILGPEGETTLDMVSGGEKIAIALALRLGITKTMSKGNINTILLDEPTIHLDGYRRHELIDLLRRMQTLPQMIIVTHDEELESAADNIIKISKKDGISDVILTD